MSGGSNLRSSSSYRRLNPLCLKLSIIAPRFCCHQCKSSIYVSRFSLHLGVASELLTCGKKARPKQRKVRVHVESLEASGRRFVDAWRRAKRGEPVHEEHLSFESLEGLLATL